MRPRWVLRAAAAWLCLATGAAQPAPPPAQVLRVCLPDRDFPPYLVSDPAAPGRVPRLLADSARGLGIEPRITRLPALRCRNATRDGLFDLVPLAPAASNLRELDFPMRAGRPDPQRKLLHLQVLVIRKRGQAADWDGRQFLQTGQIGLRRGSFVITDTLQAMGRHYDDAAFSSEQLLRKLAAGRVDLALLFREEWEAALPGLPAQELETLARPFIETDLYLAAGRHLDPAQRRLVQAWWDAIGQLREPPVLRN